MPRAIGMGSHFILVPLSAEFNRDLKDSFRWKFCWSKAARDDEKLRVGRVMRAWRRVGGEYRVRAGARMSCRAQVEGMLCLMHTTRGAVKRKQGVSREDGDGEV
jgi:hypothetical protein